MVADSILPLLQLRLPGFLVEFRQTGENEMTVILDGVITEIRGSDKGITEFLRRGILDRVVNGIYDEICQEIQRRGGLTEEQREANRARPPIVDVDPDTFVPTSYPPCNCGCTGYVDNKTGRRPTARSFLQHLEKER